MENEQPEKPLEQATPTLKKFDLVGPESIDLKLYFFTLQFGQVPINIHEDFHAVFGYNRDEAFKEVLASYQSNIPVVVKDRAFVDVKRILSVLNDPIATAKVPVEHIKEEPKQKTAEEFIHGMLLISDMFVPDQADKDIIKAILKKIKVEKKDDNTNGSAAEGGDQAAS